MWCELPIYQWFLAGAFISLIYILIVLREVEPENLTNAVVIAIPVMMILCGPMAFFFLLLVILLNLKKPSKWLDSTFFLFKNKNKDQ